MNLEEIARLAGVSRSTVSRVINDDPRVSESARRRVQEVIREHNYHPNAAARSLASRRTRILGLRLSKAIGGIFTDPFFPLLIQGAADACNEADYSLSLLMETSPNGTAAAHLYRRVIRGRHVDGVVIASHVVDDPMIAWLQHDHFPFVLVGRHAGPDVNFVDIDNRAAAREAVEHLLDHGYRRIAMVAGPDNLIASLDRHAGYLAALDGAGIAADSSLVIFSDFTRQGGYDAMRALLDGGRPRAEAVFVASDSMASGALLALNQAGLRAPDDLAIMGFDGLAEGATTHPPLTTVQQPVADLSREAVRMLLRRIHHPETGPEQRYLPTRLIRRLSCGCPSPTLNQTRGGDTATVERTSAAAST